MRYFIYTIIGVVAAAIIGGFFVVGSPTEARLRAFDERRIQDLQTIQRQIVNFYQSKSRLPNALSELTDSISGFVAPKDPQIKEDYGYEIKGAFSFSLCATFNRPSSGGTDLNIARPMPMNGGISENWNHSAGNVCFDRTIDPELYPPYPK